jgi:hypothetical protein|tara:strand:+ start:4944 stop:5132 length:189 start_codon:yes stop_codon:yes gene_type:complete
MDFINEVDPTSLDEQNEKLSVNNSLSIEDMIDFESIIFDNLNEGDEESDDYYLFNFGVGGPA